MLNNDEEHNSLSDETLQSERASQGSKLPCPRISKRLQNQSGLGCTVGAPQVIYDVVRVQSPAKNSKRVRQLKRGHAKPVCSVG